MHGVLAILCHQDTNHLMISAEAGELGAVPELELDQVGEQVVGRRRDGAMHLVQEEMGLVFCLALTSFRSNLWVGAAMEQEKKIVAEARPGSALRSSLSIGRAPCLCLGGQT